MQAIAVTATEQFTDVTLEVPTCGPDDVLVKVAFCGICGSDVPRYFDGAVHNFPQVLGHEFSGTVSAVGDAVTHVSPGDRVAVAPLVPCHDCAHCRAGRPSLCPRYSFIGSRQQGALAEYVLAPGVNVVPVGDLPLKTAALIEPMTVALHGLDLVPFEPGTPAVVLGGGVIGLMSVIALSARGAGDITVVDVNPWVLEMCRRFGADHTIDGSTQDVASEVARIGAPSIAIETAGAPATVAQSLQVLTKGGRAVYVGTPSASVTFERKQWELVLRKELGLFGSWMSYSAPFPGREWSEAPRLLTEAREDPQTIVTHEFALADVASGFRVMRGSGENRLKVMFKVDDEVRS